MISTLKKKKLNKKGFTLAELLIVVAIIAVLAAIAIPVFSGQLTKAKIAADKANVRAWYAECTANYLTNETQTDVSKGTAATTVTVSGATITLQAGKYKYDEAKKAVVYTPDSTTYASETLVLPASDAFKCVS